MCSTVDLLSAETSVAGKQLANLVNHNITLPNRVDGAVDLLSALSQQVRAALENYWNGALLARKTQGPSDKEDSYRFHF